MINYTKKEVARLIDISAVQAQSTYQDVMQVIETAKAHQLICVFSMPCFVDDVVRELQGTKGIEIGGVVGFPSGSESTECKLFQAQQQKDKGCTEIDMVINIGQLKSGLLQQISEEIKAIKACVAPLPLKVIIEVALLSDTEIVTAAKLVRDAGADFVKTGTGWQGATTLHHVQLIKEAVGDSIKLKVAGGVRDLETLKTMHQMGVSRFGIGYKSVLHILDACHE